MTASKSLWSTGAQAFLSAQADSSCTCNDQGAQQYTSSRGRHGVWVAVKAHSNTQAAEADTGCG